MWRDCGQKRTADICAKLILELFLSEGTPASRKVSHVLIFDRVVILIFVLSRSQRLVDLDKDVIYFEQNCELRVSIRLSIWPTNKSRDSASALAKRATIKSATSCSKKQLYARRGSLSRTLNLRNAALFLRKEKSRRATDSLSLSLSLLGDNCSVPSGLGNYFARIRVARYTYTSRFISISLLRQRANNSRRLFSVDRCQNDLYPRAFLLGDIPDQ